jgi:curved DNA-binding protein CbpA
VDPTKDYYLILEVHTQASVEIIDRAKRVLLLRHHPDHNVGDAERASEQTRLVIEAHTVLSDPAQRYAYDSARASGGKQRREATPDKATRRADSGESTGDHALPSGPRARAKQSRPASSNASTQPGVRVVTCQSCGAVSPVRAELSPEDVTCGACGERVRLRLGSRVRNALGRMDDGLERGRAWVLGFLPGRSGSVRPRRREKSS